MANEDVFIQRQVEEALKNARLLRNADIRIETKNGEVILHGFVDVLAEKWKAGEIASQIPGVAAVDNSLTVALDRQLEDDEIAEQIQEEFLADPRTDLHQITVSVKGGVVYLEGDVGSVAEVETAKELSARVQGVKDVISYLKLGQGVFEIDDATLTNAVETAFSRSPSVSVRDIETQTRDGKVFISGTVDTQEQAEAAVRIAAQVPGVKKVTSNLDTRHGSKDADYMLTNALREELGANGLGGVKCYVVDRIAFLDGAVGTPDQKHHAEEIASRCKGIEGINNDIQIS